jgi:hypothetical protein
MAEWKKVVVSGSSAELSGLTVDNTIVGSIDGNAATVTTAPQLTGDVTTNGSTNVTTIANNAVETAMIADLNVTNAKLAHDGLMIGSTDISLGATGSSLAGLTDVTLSGRVSAANVGASDGSSTLTGSFAGDGSALTGIPDATDAKFLVYTTGSGTNSIVGTGGGLNIAAGNCSVVNGGLCNDIQSNISTVGGGSRNAICSTAGCGTIAGGSLNGIIDGEHNSIGGGCNNLIFNGTHNTISGGYINFICNNSHWSTISGGYRNYVTGNYSTLGGGINNCANAESSGVLSGRLNINAGQQSVIAGGCSNNITSAGSNGGILGGVSNTVNSSKSFIVGNSISSTVACHTHVNNLTTAGNITGSNICGTGRVQGATMGIADGSSTITGSFAGDGSALTGLPAAAIETYSGGVANRIITAVDGSSVEGEANLTFDGSTLTVTGAATVSTDLTVSRNLIVQGTASFQHTEDLDIADRFIRMASGSTSAGDGGIVIQQTSALNGEVFGFDSAQTRFGLSGSFDASQNTFTPDAFLSAVVVGGSGETKSDVVARYQKPGNIFVQDNGDVHIYV